MKPPSMSLIRCRRNRSSFSLGSCWASQLGFALTVFALASGCKHAEDECNTDGNDCDRQPLSWVEYGAPRLNLQVEHDGEYRMRITSDAAETLCMTGRLDDHQLAAVDAVQQSDLMDTYLLDDGASGGGPADRFVYFRPIDGENEWHYLELNSEGTLQPETAVLIDTLDGISLDLYERAEYCTEGDRALAANGDWVFPISE